MQDTWITDATHFLGENGEVHPSAARLGIVKHTGAIVTAMTEQTSGAAILDVRCRRRPRRARCTGAIEAEYEAMSGAILWECPSCGDRGRISSWQGTVWDRSTELGNRAP